MRASRPRQGGQPWCGAFANAQHRRAGLDPDLYRIFMATRNAEHFFRYQRDGRIPGWIHAEGDWHRVEEVHHRRGSSRQWWNADAVRSLQVTPQPGDIVLIDNAAGLGADHVAMVHSYDPSSHRLTLIDGNGGGFVVDPRPAAGDRDGAADPARAHASAATGGRALRRGGDGDVTVSVRDLDDAPTNARVAADAARATRDPQNPARRQVTRIYGIGRFSVVDYEDHEYRDSVDHPGGGGAAGGSGSGERSVR